MHIFLCYRFANKEAWLEAHRNSTVYKKYKAWQAAANIQVLPKWAPDVPCDKSGTKAVGHPANLRALSSAIRCPSMAENVLSS